VAYNPTTKPLAGGGGSGASRADDGGDVGPAAEDPEKRKRIYIYIYSTHADTHDQMSRNGTSSVGARTARGRRRRRRAFPLGSVAMGGVPVKHIGKRKQFPRPQQESSTRRARQREGPLFVRRDHPKKGER
jgi:hypothetical protein